MPRGTETVQQALSYITACLVDPNCVLEGAAAIRATAEADDHDDHDDHGQDTSGGSKYVGMKVGLAVGFFVLTVVASYIPLLFKVSEHYSGILACLNVFSGSTFLSVGILHLLPHVTDYESMADLDTDFPVGLSLVVIGFLLVLFVEQVLLARDGADGDGAVSAASAEGSAEGAKSGDLTAKDGSGKGGSATDSEFRGSVVEQTQALWQKYHSPLIAEAAVVLHAVLESLVLGLTGKKHSLWLLFWAIASHKGFTAMSQATRFLRLGCPPGLLFLLLAPFHILPPLGVLLGTVVGGEDVIAGLILSALSTGTFIYIGAYEVISDEFGCHSHGDEAPAAATALTGGNVEGGAGGNNQQESGAKSGAWFPSRMVKFMVLVFGCGVIYAITAALPSHDELHGH